MPSTAGRAECQSLQQTRAAGLERQVQRVSLILDYRPAAAQRACSRQPAAHGTSMRLPRVLRQACASVPDGAQHQAWGGRSSHCCGSARLCFKVVLRGLCVPEPTASCVRRGPAASAMCIGCTQRRSKAQGLCLHSFHQTTGPDACNVQTSGMLERSLHVRPRACAQPPDATASGLAICRPSVVCGDLRTEAATA